MIRSVLSFFHHLVCPPCCAACGSRMFECDLFLCTRCLEQVRPIVSHTIKITRQSKMRVYAVCAYRGPLKQLVLRKYQRRIFASHALAHIMWRSSVAPQLKCTVLVPVPMHWTRYMWRGYNQAEEMARVLARNKGCSCAQLVRRARRTRLQSRLSKVERQNNVRGVFHLNGTRADLAAYVGAHVVLVDDLTTTGSTLREVARELLPLRPASISALVACRSI